jgi:hypothetical protein
MSEANQPGGSRPVQSRLPGTKSALPDFGGLSESEQIEFLRDVLLTADWSTDRDVLVRVAEFVEEYPDRACLPISNEGSFGLATSSSLMRCGKPRTTRMSRSGRCAGPTA